MTAFDDWAYTQKGCVTMRDIWKAACEYQREKDAVLVATNDIVSGSIGPLFNAGWRACQSATAKAIREQEVE